MKKVVLCTSIYAALIFVGGIIGYCKSHSHISLVLGSTFASFLGFSSFLIAKNRPEGKPLAIFFTVIMIGLFSYKFFINPKIFPSATFLLFSIGMLAILLQPIRSKKDHFNISKELIK